MFIPIIERPSNKIFVLFGKGFLRVYFAKFLVQLVFLVAFVGEDFEHCGLVARFDDGGMMALGG